jgi:GNAT superfamily N-acetyltransferase
MANHSGLVRRLWQTDSDLFTDHLLRLDPETRRSRFAGGVSDDFLRYYADRALSWTGATFAWVDSAVIRGVGELRSENEHEAEAAFTVEAGLRRHGIGAALFRRVMLYARNHGIKAVHVRCIPVNDAMQGLARKHGAKLVNDAGDVLGELETGSATPLSLLQEAWVETVTFPMAIYDLASGRAATTNQGVP